MFFWRNNLKIDAKQFIVPTAIVLLMMASCVNPKKNSQKYFQVDSLLRAQTTYLTQSKAKLFKSARLGEKVDSASYVPKDTSEWLRELDALYQLAAINKPVYQGLYTTKDLPDANSNLRVRSYEASGGENDIPVRYLRLYYMGNLSRLKRIEGLYMESNPLYKGSNFISIQLQDVYNKTMVTSYSLKGAQKMILADSLDFVIDGEISLKQN
jgi:hypothetical protein